MCVFVWEACLPEQCSRALVADLARWGALDTHGRQWQLHCVSDCARRVLATAVPTRSREYGMFGGSVSDCNTACPVFSSVFCLRRCEGRVTGQTVAHCSALPLNRTKANKVDAPVHVRHPPTGLISKSHRDISSPHLPPIHAKGPNPPRVQCLVSAANSLKFSLKLGTPSHRPPGTSHMKRKATLASQSGSMGVTRRTYKCQQD